jgi:hypothetical protein
MCVHVFSDGFC